MSGDEIRRAKIGFCRHLFRVNATTRQVTQSRQRGVGGFSDSAVMHALFGSTAHTVFPAIAGIRWNRLLNDQTASVIITMEAQQNIVTPREKATGK